MLFTPMPMDILDTLLNPTSMDSKVFSQVMVALIAILNSKVNEQETKYQCMFMVCKLDNCKGLSHLLLKVVAWEIPEKDYIPQVEESFKQLLYYCYENLFGNFDKFQSFVRQALRFDVDAITPEELQDMTIVLTTDEVLNVQNMGFFDTKEELMEFITDCFTIEAPTVNNQAEELLNDSIEVLKIFMLAYGDDDGKFLYEEFLPLRNHIVTASRLMYSIAKSEEVGDIDDDDLARFKECYDVLITDKTMVVIDCCYKLTNEGMNSVTAAFGNRRATEIPQDELNELNQKISMYKMNLGAVKMYRQVGMVLQSLAAKFHW